MTQTFTHILPIYPTDYKLLDFRPHTNATEPVLRVQCEEVERFCCCCSQWRAARSGSAASDPVLIWFLTLQLNGEMEGKLSAFFTPKLSPLFSSLVGFWFLEPPEAAVLNRLRVENSIQGQFIARDQKWLQVKRRFFFLFNCWPTNDWLLFNSKGKTPVQEFLFTQTERS